MLILFAFTNNEPSIAIHDYRHDYPELPKHPVPKEDVTAHDNPLFHQPKPQPVLHTILQEPMIEMESAGE